MPGAEIVLSGEQWAALAEFGRDVTQASRRGSFFRALLQAAGPQLGDWFAARGGAVLSVTHGMLRQAMLETLTLELSTPGSLYERFLPPGMGSHFLRNQLREEEGDPAVLADLAPHLAADTFGLRTGLRRWRHPGSPCHRGT